MVPRLLALRIDEAESAPIRRFFSGKIDSRLPAKERIVALWSDRESRAYPFSSLSEKRVINDEFDGQSIVVLWTPGTASALDSREIAEGRDVGSSGVYSRHVGGRKLTFESAGDSHFRDRETGSTWTILGEAVDGELKGTHLDPVQHGNLGAALGPDGRLYVFSVPGFTTSESRGSSVLCGSPRCATHRVSPSRDNAMTSSRMNGA